MSEIILTINGVDPLELYGEKNAKLNLFRKAFPEVTITSRGNSLKLTGEKKYTQKAKAKFELMVRLLKQHKELPAQVVEDILKDENPYKAKLGNGDAIKTIVHGRGGKANSGENTESAKNS